MVHDGQAAIDHYRTALGAVETERYDHEGKIGHATLRINGADVMLSDEYPEYLDTVGTLVAQGEFSGLKVGANMG